jgi:hypothetical protein
MDNCCQLEGNSDANKLTGPAKGVVGRADCFDFDFSTELLPQTAFHDSNDKITVLLQMYQENEDVHQYCYFTSTTTRTIQILHRNHTSVHTCCPPGA